MAIQVIAWGPTLNRLGFRDDILASRLQHNGFRQGVDVQIVNTLTNGLIDCEHLESLVNHDTFLVAVALANNETGVIQPISNVVAICDRLGVPVHADAVQAIDKLDVQFCELGISSMTVSAHKVHGPRGSGALITRHGHAPSCFHGGFQQSAVRPGRNLSHWQPD